MDILFIVIVTCIFFYYNTSMFFIYLLVTFSREKLTDLENAISHINQFYEATCSEFANYSTEQNAHYNLNLEKYYKCNFFRSYRFCVTQRLL